MTDNIFATMREHVLTALRAAVPGYSAWSASQSRASSWVGAPVAPPQPRQLYVRSWCAA